MMIKTTREAVSSLLVTDNYFGGKNLPLKIWQTVVAVVAWLVVAMPFVWLASPTLHPVFSVSYTKKLVQEELTDFQFLGEILGVIFGFILLLYVGLTLLNNRRFRRVLRKKNLWDAKRLEQRELIMEDVYRTRFGSVEERQSVRYYSVREEQNLPKELISELYREKGVPL